VKLITGEQGGQCTYT